MLPRSQRRTPTLLIVAVMVGATLATFVPSANAQAPIVTATVTSVTPVLWSGTAFIAIPGGHVIQPGDHMGFHVVGTVGCSVGTPALQNATAQATVSGLLRKSTNSAVVPMNMTGSAFDGYVSVDVEGDVNNGAATGGIEDNSAGSIQVSVTPSVDCAGAGTAVQGNAQTKASDNFAADTRSPRRVVDMPFAIKQGPLSGRPDFTAIAGIGATVTIGDGTTAIFDDLHNIGSVTADLKTPFGWGATTATPLQASKTPAAYAFMINDSTGGASPAHADGNTSTPYDVTVSDQYGNSHTYTTATAKSIPVDNVPPSVATLDLTGTHAYLNLSARVANSPGTELNKFQRAFTASQNGGETVPWARLRIKVGSGADTPVGTVLAPSDSASTHNWTTFSIADDPATPLDENQIADIHYFLVPADWVGNEYLGNEASTETVFPRMEIHYGRDLNNPAVMSGTDLGPIAINFTANTPTAPFAYPAAGAASATPGSLYGELVRERLDGTATYWKTGSAGSSSDFVATEDHSIADTTKTSTVFIPSRPITAADLTNGAAIPWNLTNISRYAPGSNQQTVLHNNLNFVDGTYDLLVNLTGDNGNTVQDIMRFRVDSTDPVIGTHRNYTHQESVSAGKGLYKNDSLVTHGGDLNPLRILVNLTDWARASDGSPKDSGLANVTVEVMSNDLNTYIPDTTTPAGGDQLARAVRFNFTHSDCSTHPKTDNTPHLLPYCYDLTWLTPQNFLANCLAPAPDMADPCSVYDNVTAFNLTRNPPLSSTATGADDKFGNQSVTFFTQNAFAGWINTTMPNLPAGSYSIRVLATDNAGRTKGDTTTYSYLVAPTVELKSSGNTPAVKSDGSIDVTVYAAAHYAAPLPPDVKGNCIAGANNAVADICPANVTVYVSNSNADVATGNTGVKYVTYTSLDFDTSAAGQYKATDLAGWQKPTNFSQAGYLTYSDRDPLLATSTLFTNVSFTNAPLSSFPGGNTINLANAVFVRAVATDASGTAINSTGWLRAISATAQSIAINAPGVDWALNHSNTRIPFNFSVDRRQNLPAPTISWYVSNASAPSFDSDVCVSLCMRSAPNITAVNKDSTTANGLFNYTGFLDPTGAQTPLPIGDYRLDVIAWDPASKTTDLRELGRATRLFSVVGDTPIALGLADSEGDVGKDGISQATPNSVIYTNRTFKLPFTIHHGAANLTSTSQLGFTLTHGGTSSATPITSGTDGFLVSTVAQTPLDKANNLASFVATVTLPNGAIDGDRYHLLITAGIDVPPYTFTNLTYNVNFNYDNAPPGGGALVSESQLTVLDPSTVGTSTVLDQTNPSPAFVGIVQDRGAGVGEIDARIYDQTANVTIRLSTTDPKGYVTVPGDSQRAEDVISGFAPAGSTLLPYGLPGVTYTGPDSLGRSGFRIPLTGTTFTDNTDPAHPKPKLYSPVANGCASNPCVINTSHTFVIYTRVLDALYHTSGWTSTTLTLDGAPPTLGYSGRLGSTSAMKSGLTASATSVAWHGAATITARVLDNQCLASVRLKGAPDGATSAVVMANMTLLTTNSGGAPVYCGRDLLSMNPPYSTWSIDLSTAPNMTDVIGNYTYWFEAQDQSGQISEIPANFRTFKMNVFDNSPALIEHYFADPAFGQAGGRTLLKADVFDNYQIDHVDIKVSDARTGQLLAATKMKPENASILNTTTNVHARFVADTQDDLNLTLNIGDYFVNITPYDVNWNRTDNPTCPAGFCIGGSFHYIVRDDGVPLGTLESPTDGAMVNATPTFKLRALYKNLTQADISVTAGVSGSEVTIPAANLTFGDLLSSNGTRQGYSVAYAPPALPDGANYTVNLTVRSPGATNATSYHFRVDALPPTVHANVTGTQDAAGKTWATAQTRIEIAANDTVTATPTIQYSVNGGAPATYSSPITPSGSDGQWALEYWAVDAVGNAATRQNITLWLDHTGPRISIATPADDLLLTVSDAGVGVNASTVVVHYRYGDTSTFATAAASQVAGNSYAAHLPGNASATGLAFYVTADDIFGNTGSNSTAAAPYVIPKVNTGGGDTGNGTGGGGNNTGGGDNNPVPPTIHINKPAAGDVAHPPSVTINWTATDPNGLPVTVSIATRTPAPGSVIAAASDNNGTWTWNISHLASGAYTLVLTASNGQATASDNVTFNIDATPPIVVVNPPPPHASQGQPVQVGVQISPSGKTVKSANYRLLNNGAISANGKLTASSGVYAASITPTAPGNYKVFADIQYSDGTQDLSVPIGTFSVAGAPVAPGHVLHGSLIAIAAIAVLTVALAAYGAFGRWRK